MKSTLMMLALLFSCFTATATARADGFRSYISPSGSDNRPCTRNQPCRTFDGAIAKTDEGGEVIALETSVYDPVTVTKSVTLTAVPTADVVIRATTGKAVTVNATASAIVVLRGLKIAGPGRNSGTFGVFVDPQTDGFVLSIENCVISDFGIGIKATDLNAVQVVISDTVIRNNNTGAAVSIFGADSMSAAITRTRFERNSIGLEAGGGNTVAVKESAAVSNDTGFLAGAGGHISIFNSIASRNTTGVETKHLGVIYIGYSTVTGNNVGLDSQGSIRTMGNNMVAGNDLEVAGAANVTSLAAW